HQHRHGLPRLCLPAAVWAVDGALARSRAGGPQARITRFPQPRSGLTMRRYSRHGRPPMLLRNAWYIAAWADEVGDTPLARRICNDPVVLFRDRNGRAAALADRCCHRSAPLSLGRVVEEGIECGYHGLVIDGAGCCVKVPGQRLIPDEARVKTYPLVEKNQLVWLWMG